MVIGDNRPACTKWIRRDSKHHCCDATNFLSMAPIMFIPTEPLSSPHLLVSMFAIWVYLGIDFPSFEGNIQFCIT